MLGFFPDMDLVILLVCTFSLVLVVIITLRMISHGNHFIRSLAILNLFTASATYITIININWDLGLTFYEYPYSVSVIGTFIELAGFNFLLNKKHHSELEILRMNEVIYSNKLLVLEKAALQAQMNPHFIFNCLNSIQNFIMDNDKESAMEYLGRFAKLIRLNLRASAETKISLQDETSILENYLSLEQLRLSDRFNFSIRLNNIQNTENIMLPPMLIQPFVENAVIHGMKHKEGGGKISVVFTRSNEYLQVSIKDNGELYNKAVASKPDTKKSYGVSITKKRLAHNNLRNDSNYKIENTLAGTTVNIEIKL